MKLNREILRLSAPAIISNITVPLLSLCDTAIAGHLDKVEYIGAVAIGSMMANALFWLFGFLRMGTSGLTAQAFGAKNNLDIRRLLLQGSMLGALAGLLLIIFNVPLANFLIRLMEPDSGVAMAAQEYFSIIILGAPALLSTLSILGWMLGMQSTIGPMIISIGVNVINIIFSVVYVFVLHLGIKGIALGTLTANWMGLVWAIIMANRFMSLKNMWVGWKPLLQKNSLRRFFSVNRDIFFRSACIMAVSLTVTAIGARLGAIVLACNAVMMQFFSFFSYFMDGLAFTAEALCGRFAGEKNVKMLRLVIKKILMWGAITAVVFTLIYVTSFTQIAAFITDKGEVLKMVKDYSFWIKILPSIAVGAFIFDGVFIGLTATKKMLIATFMSAVVFFMIAFVKINHLSITLAYPQNNILWTAFLAYLLARGLLLACMTPKVSSLTHLLPD